MTKLRYVLLLFIIQLFSIVIIFGINKHDLIRNTCCIYYPAYSSSYCIVPGRLIRGYCELCHALISLNLRFNNVTPGLGVVSDLCHVAVMQLSVCTSS